MSYNDRVLQLRVDKHRPTFEFRFEDLFSEEEWLNMSLKERQQQEKTFRHDIEKMDDIRIPYASLNRVKNKLFNVTYTYNGIKANFKQNEQKSNSRDRNR